MLSVVVALLANAGVFAVILVLVSLSEPPSTVLRDWMFQAVPSYMQGFGTIAAAWVAYIVFGEWRTQERVRRNADAAEELLVAAYNAANAIRSLRRPGWGYKNPITKEDLQLFLGTYQAGDFERSEPFIEALRARLAFTKIMFDKGAANALLTIVQMHNTVRHAKRDLDFLANLNQLLVDSGLGPTAEDWQIEAEKALVDLGAVQLRGRATVTSLIKQGSAVDKSIEDALENLQGVLEPHIRLLEPPKII